MWVPIGVGACKREWAQGEHKAAFDSECGRHVVRFWNLHSLCRQSELHLYPPNLVTPSLCRRKSFGVRGTCVSLSDFFLVVLHK